MSTTELLLGAHLGALSVLSLYGLHRYQLVWRYLKHKERPPRLPSPLPERTPFVLLQLPLYNEPAVAERLINACCALNYPHERLLIQVLDDSTDGSDERSRACVARWASQGLPIEHIKRAERVGFKAGALDEGLARAPHAELVAIFDADFIPPADFLMQTTPHFGDLTRIDLTQDQQGVGVVQARWTHLNRASSWLTRAQAILLDGHFMIEHTARHRSACFFNFNGTAGLWDARCIEDAGGWQHDTLTEDLDLSYRAQMKGWRFVFLNDVTAPAELPEGMLAFKAQQHRWAKGSIQVALKLLPRLTRSQLSPRVKREAWLHLTGNLAYVLMVCLSVLTPLTLKHRSELAWGWLSLLEALVFVGATLSVVFFYGLSQREVSPQRWRHRLLTLPLVLALGIGLAVNNSRATLEALLGYESPFVRTPKQGAQGGEGGGALERALGDKTQPEGRRHSRGHIQWAATLSALLELSLAAHFGYGVSQALQEGLWASLPFMLLFMCGFLMVGLGSVREMVRW